MTTEQVLRALRAMNRRRPFRRYIVEFMSGDRLTITHPEAIGPEGDLLLFRAPDREQRVFNGESVCQLLTLE